MRKPFACLITASILVHSPAPAIAGQPLWQELRAQAPGPFAAIVAGWQLLCGRADLRNNAGATLDRFRSDARWRSASYSARAFDRSGMVKELAFDSVYDMKRIVVERGERRGSIRYYDISQRRNTIEIDATFNSDCEMTAFSILRNGKLLATPGSLRPPAQDPVCGSTTTDAHPVVLAVVDGGVDVTHLELAPHLLRDANGEPVYLNYKSFDKNYNHDEHGTHVAGIASAHSPRIQILPIERPSDDILGTSPGHPSWPLRTELVELGIRAINEDQYESIATARKLGARVVNMSFGARYAESNADRTRFVDGPRGMLDGFLRAIREFSDVLFVVSAQNHGRNIDTTKYFPASVAAPNQIVVAAVDPNGKILNFSNYGPKTVDLAAPGHLIDSLSPTDGWLTASHKLGHREMSGTSMAAPAVSHVAAEMLARNPTLTPEQVKQILCATVTPSAELKAITRCGGVLNPEAALHSVPK